MSNDPTIRERLPADIEKVYTFAPGELVILRLDTGVDDIAGAVAAARAACPDNHVLAITGDVTVVRSEMADECYRIGVNDAREVLEMVRPFVDMVVNEDGGGMPTSETARRVRDAIDEVLEGGAA